MRFTIKAEPTKNHIRPEGDSACSRTSTYVKVFRRSKAPFGAAGPGGLAVAFFLMMTVALAAGNPEARAAVDRIVAVVNGEVITKKQLDTKMTRVPPAQREAMKSKVLEAMIDQELMSQAAKAKGVFVTESDVSTALESIKKENKLTDAQFRASLAQSGTTVEAFREDLRMELLRSRVLGAQVMSKIVITDSEVRAFLRGEGPDLGAVGGATGDTRPLRMIIIPLDPRNKAKSLAEARRIKAEIEGGLDFTAAAKKYSKGPGRDKGGDPGDGATVANLPPEMQQALLKQASGQPIDPVEAGGNAVVLIAALGDPPAPPQAAEPSKDKKKKGKDNPDEFTAEARETARRQLERYKMQQRYGEWVKELKRNAIIRVNL